MVGTLAVLLVLLVVAVVVTTPWRALDAGALDVTAVDPARDFTVAEQAAAAHYQHAVQPPVLLGVALGLALALLLGLTTLGARIVTAAGSLLGGGWWAQTVLGGLALLLVGRLAVLPTDLWAARVRRETGLLVQPWSAWAVEQARLFALTAAVTLGALTVLVLLARHFPQSWWVVGATLAAGLVVAGSFLYPLVVEPLVTQVTPLPEGPARTALLAARPARRRDSSMRSWWPTPAAGRRR